MNYNHFKMFVEKNNKRRLTLVLTTLIKQEKKQIKGALRDDGFHDIIELDNFDDAWEKLKLATTNVVIFSVENQDGQEFLKDLIASTRFKQSALIIFSNKTNEHSKMFAAEDHHIFWREAPMNPYKVEEGLFEAMKSGFMERSLTADEAMWLENYNKALEEINEGNFSAAKELLRLTLKENPNFFEAYLKMAEVLVELGDFETAKKVLARAEAMAPTHPGVLRLRGLIVAETQGKEAALREFEIIITQKPNDPMLVVDLGNIAFKKGWNKEAIDLYEKAREIDPNLIHVYNKLGIAHSREGRYDDSMFMYNKALGIDANDAGIHFNIGMMYFRKRDAGKALEYFRKANQLDTTMREPQEMIAKLSGRA